MTGNEYISEETVLQKLLFYCYGHGHYIYGYAGYRKAPLTIPHFNSQNMNNFKFSFPDTKPTHQDCQIFCFRHVHFMICSSYPAVGQNIIHGAGAS
jgi:hypothetical protein